MCACFGWFLLPSGWFLLPPRQTCLPPPDPICGVSSSSFLVHGDGYRPRAERHRRRGRQEPDIRRLPRLPAGKTKVRRGRGLAKRPKISEGGRTEWRIGAAGWAEEIAANPKKTSPAGGLGPRGRKRRRCFLLGAQHSYPCRSVNMENRSTGAAFWLSRPVRFACRRCGGWRQLRIPRFPSPLRLALVPRVFTCLHQSWGLPHCDFCFFAGAGAGATGAAALDRANPAHPYSKFGTGNKRTLLDGPSAEGKSARQALLRFFDA